MQLENIPIDSEFHELSIHGTYEFPFAVYKDQLNKNLIGFVNLHWHEEIQFSYVIKGQIEFTVDNKSYILNKNQCLFINSEKLHMAKPVNEPDSTFICINIHPRFFSAYSGSIIETKYTNTIISNNAPSAIVISNEEPWGKYIIDKINLILNVYRDKDNNYELSILIECLEIWKIIYEKCSFFSKETISNSIYEDRLKKILLYIQKNYNKKIKLSDLACAANVSTGECCRMFKKHNLKSPIDYVINFRLNKSLELLQTTSLTISEIAYKTGFGSVSYYVEKFRCQIGITPLEYRKKVRLCFS